VVARDYRLSVVISLRYSSQLFAVMGAEIHYNGRKFKINVFFRSRAVLLNYLDNRFDFRALINVHTSSLNEPACVRMHTDWPISE
jgi:hypothetical protein